jgi:hypothetical protein
MFQSPEHLKVKCRVNRHPNPHERTVRMANRSATVVSRCMVVRGTKRKDRSEEEKVTDRTGRQEYRLIERQSPVRGIKAGVPEERTKE